MKNVLELTHQITTTDITFCYGEKAYKKYLSKVYNCTEYIKYEGVTTIVTNAEGSFSIVIGVKQLDNIYTLKGLIVHELNHAVTELMNHYGFSCDEKRSYTLQWLYEAIMPFIDKRIIND